jgi:hypothetical protein
MPGTLRQPDTMPCSHQTGKLVTCPVAEWPRLEATALVACVRDAGSPSREQLERHRAYDEEIQLIHTSGMIAQQSFPSLVP